MDQRRLTFIVALASTISHTGISPACAGQPSDVREVSDVRTLVSGCLTYAVDDLSAQETARRLRLNRGWRLLPNPFVNVPNDLYNGHYKGLITMQFSGGHCSASFRVGEIKPYEAATADLLNGRREKWHLIPERPPLVAGMRHLCDESNRFLLTEFSGDPKMIPSLRRPVYEVSISPSGSICASSQTF